MPVAGPFSGARAARIAVAALGTAVCAAPAAAQESGSDRFFFTEKESEQDLESTTYDGSLTSTSFYYRESGAQAAPLSPGTTGPLVASPFDRVFTDLRGQLRALHIAGSKVDFHADVRGRYTTSHVNEDANGDPREVPFQSGRLHGNEAEVRELYLTRDGENFDVTLGRQFMLELAAVKFDGLRVDKDAGKKWRYMAFAGAYPTRGSRDVREDYPVLDADLTMAGVQPGGRIVPITGGGGASYRYEGFYGAFGLVGILPLADDRETGQIEETRVFGTANGYWRQSANLDLYHYVVLDALGAGGAGFTNLTLGANWQPRQTLRVYGQINRVDTETLNVTAQTQLEEPDPQAGTAIQNNIEVARISSESARVGVSASIKNRFEVATSGTVRRRPELRIETADDAMVVVFPAAQAADITVTAIDRKSIKDLRLALSVTRSMGIGNVNLYRSKSTIARLDGQREIMDGKAQVEGAFTYIDSKDDNRGATCNLSQIETCYGAAEVKSFSLSGTGFYRVGKKWFAIASLALGRQLMSATDSAGDLQSQPAVTTANLFVRLAYRF